MKRIRIIGLVLATVFTCEATVAAQGLEAGSTWQNSRGSTLHIEAVDPTGRLTGYYINQAPGFGCQNSPYPVTGWIFGNTITFAVKWENPIENCQSQTAWTGFYADGEITTLWYLVSIGTTSKDQIQGGGDVFVRTTQKTSKLLPEK